MDDLAVGDPEDRETTNFLPASPRNGPVWVVQRPAHDNAVALRDHSSGVVQIGKARAQARTSRLHTPRAIGIDELVRHDVAKRCEAIRLDVVVVEPLYVLLVRFEDEHASTVAIAVERALDKFTGDCGIVERAEAGGRVTFNIPKEMPDRQQERVFTAYTNGSRIE